MWWRRRVLLLLVAVAALLVPAAPAWAHAQLQATTPAAGARLATAPSSVTLYFSEAVTITPQAVEVFDSRGRRVDAGAARHPAAGADWVVAPLRPHLPDGSYAVAWRAVSADTHPVQGAFAFVVGAGALGGVSTAGSADATDAVVGAAFALARWAGFCGLALLIGGAMFLLLCWPGGRLDRRTRLLLWSGWAVVSAASFVSLCLQGPYTSGGGLSAALATGTLGQTLTTRYGVVLSARLVLLGLAAIWLTSLLPRRTAEPWPPTVPPGPAEVANGSVLALGLLVTWPATGHASAGWQVPLATAVDVTHLGAMCLWLGGLAVLATSLMPRRRAAELARALPVFSRLAFVSVAVLVVTGTYQSWRQVGTLPAFTGTEYGRLLLVKLVGVVVLIGLGNVARLFVRRNDARGPDIAAVEPAPVVELPALVGGRPAAAATLPAPPAGPPRTDGDGDSPPGIGRLRRSLLVELLIGAAVLALTAVLVASAPARDTYHPPARVSLTLPSATAQVVVTPARAGQDLIDVRLLDRAGRPLTVPEVRGSLSLPTRRVSGLAVRFDRAGPGHYTSSAAEFPFAGKWQLALTVRTSDFDEATATATVRIR